MFPGNAGGTNWGSVAIEPSRRVAILNMSNLPFVVRLIPRADFEREERRPGAPRAARVLTAGRHAVRDVAPSAAIAARIALLAPPWGTLAAVDLDTGDILWQVPLGSIPDQAPLPSARSRFRGCRISAARS